MEYFVIKDLGYDGTAISKYDSKGKAEKAYQEALADITAQIVTLGEEEANKGLALIEGSTLKSQYMDEIW